VFETPKKSIKEMSAKEIIFSNKKDYVNDE
jgi:hypothetical protein